MAGPVDSQASGLPQKLSTAQWLLLLALIPCAVVTGLTYLYVRRMQPPNRHEKGTKSMPGDRHEESNLRSTVTEKALLTAKPKSDPREYQYARLSNGLQVVNIRDPSAKTIGVAVSVQVGSLNDPKDTLGLAHFCEHMLFLGTKRYPDPASFDRFVQTYGGGNNAYTADEDTVYFLSTLKAGWQESLSRMGDFFRAPLFDRQYVDKEVYAIESEHAKNVQNPTYRTYEVMASLSDPRSHVGWFSTGDLGTLITEPKKKGLDTVDELKKFFQANYCPSKLSVVTYSDDALDSQLVDAQAQFGNIPKGTCATAGHASHQVVDAWHPKDAPARVGSWVDIQAVQARSQLMVMWPMDTLQSFYKSAPQDYVSHMLSWPGKHSLVYALKDDTGLVTRATVTEDTTSLGTTLYFMADLTHKGREHPSAVLELLYAFLAQMRHNGVDIDVYQSIAAAAQVTFDWKDKPVTQSAVTAVADAMTWLPKEDLLTGEYTIPNPEAELANEVLQKLTPDNMNVAFVDTEFKPYDPAKLKKLPHYGVPHTIRPFEEVIDGRVSQWSMWLKSKNADQYKNDLEAALKKHKINMPKEMQQARPIQDIPRDINLAHAKAQLGDDVETKLFGVRPKELPQAGGGSVWYRQGTIAESPKVYAQFLLRSGREDGDGMTAKDSLLLSVYMRLKRLLLEPETANFEATGNTHSIGIGSELSLVFKGFAESLPKLVRTVFEQVGKDMNLSNEDGQKHFDYVMEQLQDELQLYTEMPVTYAVGDRNLILQKGSRSRNEMIAAAKELKAADVPGSLKHLLLSKELHYNTLFVGNIQQTDAESLHKKCADEIHKGHGELTLSVDDVELQPSIVHPRKPIEIRKRNPKPGDLNHVTVVSLLTGIPSIEERVLLSILGDILGTLAYNEFRTKRSMGYVVNAGQIMLSNVMGMSCVVQGTMKRPDEVEPLVEWLYNVKMPEYLKVMPIQEFETLKTSFISQFESPPENLLEELDHWPTQVNKGGKCFGLRDEMIDWTKKHLGVKQQLIDAWERVLQPSQETGFREKVVVKYFGGEPDARPGSKEYYDALKAANVDEATAKQAEKEHVAALTFADANSAARAQVLEDAQEMAGKDKAYFSEDLGCSGIGSAGSLQQSAQYEAI